LISEDEILETWTSFYQDLYDHQNNEIIYLIDPLKSGGETLIKNSSKTFHPRNFILETGEIPTSFKNFIL